MKIKPTNLCITIPLLMMISMGCFANELEEKKGTSGRACWNRILFQ